MKKIVYLLIVPILLFSAQKSSLNDLTLKEAESIVKKDNLEINIAKFDERVKSLEFKIAKGYNYGALDITQIFMRTNDALNVFGAKLMSREANFRDFGFSDFLGAIGGAAQASGGNFATFTNMLGMGADQLLSTEPKDLNYPGYRNLFQTKLTYKVPLYTGGKLTQYRKIAKSMIKMSKLDTKKVVAQKLFQTKKCFFDISLLDSYIKNLKIIIKNMDILENTVKSMMKEGYAKHIDLLEVQAKKSNVLRMLNQAKANRELVYQFLSFLLDRDVTSIMHVDEDRELKKINKRLMLDNNLDIQKAKLGLKISKMAVKLQKSSFLPEVGAFGEFSTADDNFLNDFSKHKAYTVGVQLKLNLFNGGIDKANLEKARVTALKVAKQVELAKKGIALKIDKIKTEIKSYQYNIDSLNEELKLSKAIYANYLGRYKEKLVSINDVIIKQSQEIERVLKLEKVKTQKNEKILELEKIANGDLR